MKMMQELYWDRGRILAAGFGIFFKKNQVWNFFLKKQGLEFVQCVCVTKTS